MIDKITAVVIRIAPKPMRLMLKSPEKPLLNAQSPTTKNPKIALKMSNTFSAVIAATIMSAAVRKITAATVKVNAVVGIKLKIPKKNVTVVFIASPPSNQGSQTLAIAHDAAKILTMRVAIRRFFFIQ